MLSFNRPSTSINPLWPHYVSWALVVFGILAGFLRFVFVDPYDPLHCNALMNRGSWDDWRFQNWQPDGCMLHTYKQNDGSACLASRHVVFTGDSITRKLFFQLAHVLDPTLPIAPPSDRQKHTDYILHTVNSTQLSFIWDPFLNSSRTLSFLRPPIRHGVTLDTSATSRPALLVLGSGLWYLRYSESSGGLPAWEANVESILSSIARSLTKLADEIVLLPIENIVQSKLSQDRLSSMQPSDIDAMNSDLYHRINQLGSKVSSYLRSPTSLPVSFPLVFNNMLDTSQTEDGLHFSDAVVRAQANVLLNFRCNDVLPKTFPLDKTCCRSYPRSAFLQVALLCLAIFWGPCNWLWSRRTNNSGVKIRDGQMPPLIFSIATSLVFLADRTGFWLKEQKQFNALTFAFLLISALVIGLGTKKIADKDLGFLNRDQTDEWKGWMQVAILIYHYLGASQISGIYNPIRVLVASYLFMTGYGHTTFYIRKADFGFLRVAQVMVRLNLLTVFLAYVMNTDYISYYFAPLVSMWFIIIYATMALGSQFNDHLIFLVCKFLLSAGLVTWFMTEKWLLEGLFHFLETVCHIHWSAREWAFRVNLDLWIVYVGMFTALGVIKIRDYQLTDHPRWPLTIKIAIAASVAALMWYFGFELLQESKFTYNTWHPFISFIPILAFITLRNATTALRSTSSRAFAFIGTCSLETFIIQFHFWLAGDSKGVLLVIPGTSLRPVNFVITSVMFVYLSHRVAQATGDITNWICGTRSTTLPLPATAVAASHSSGRHRGDLGKQTSSGEDKVAMIQDNTRISEIETSFSQVEMPPRWVDRLAQHSSAQHRSLNLAKWNKHWYLGLKTKLGIIVGLMWAANIMWTSP